MKYVLSPILFLLTLNYSGAQCIDRDLNFTFGEKITYQVYYNWQFVWIHAGDAVFQVRKDTYKGNAVLHLMGQGASKKTYDWIYKVREDFHSYVDTAGFKPLVFTRKTQEGKYHVNNKYTYNHQRDRLYVRADNSEDGLRLDTLDLRPCTYDVLTTIYYARNIDFNHYLPGDKIPIVVIIDGKIYDLHIRYLGKENITTKHGKTYATIKFKPLLVEGTIFSGGEDMTVWVTDDANKVPVLIEARILVGSIMAVMTEAEGLRYEPTAEVMEE